MCKKHYICNIFELGYKKTIQNQPTVEAVIFRIHKTAAELTTHNIGNHQNYSSKFIRGQAQNVCRHLLYPFSKLFLE